MNLLLRRAVGHRHQRGVAAVELAIILPILAILFTVPLFYSVYFWHYTAAQKAAQHAARYLSTITVQEMRSEALARAAGTIASDIARSEVAELSKAASVPVVEVRCGAYQCTGIGSRALPDTVFVSVRMNMFDRFFGAVGTGRFGWAITADATMNYVGH
jgi:Flp pilus assembly protein TadG